MRAYGLRHWIFFYKNLELQRLEWIKFLSYIRFPWNKNNNNNRNYNQKKNHLLYFILLKFYLEIKILVPS